MKEQQLLNMIATGGFTLAYHDNGVCTFYRGLHEYDDLPKRELFNIDNGSEFTDGYIPNEVALLVKALGGKVVTI